MSMAERGATGDHVRARVRSRGHRSRGLLVVVSVAGAREFAIGRNVQTTAEFAAECGGLRHLLLMRETKLVTERISLAGTTELRRAEGRGDRPGSRGRVVAASSCLLLLDLSLNELGLVLLRLESLIFEISRRS